MIFVVEVPHVGDAHSWFAFDADDLHRKVAVGDTLQSWEVYDTTTARELLVLVGEIPGSPQAQAAFPGICRLADEYGLDTVLYRADHLLQRGCYQPEVVTLQAACEAALNARVTAEPEEGPLQAVKILWSDAEAVLASENDPFFTSRNSWRALHALREQLLSLDVLAEN
jgi:hypothetical protein